MPADDQEHDATHSVPVDGHVDRRGTRTVVCLDPHIQLLVRVPGQGRLNEHFLRTSSCLFLYANDTVSAVFTVYFTPPQTPFPGRSRTAKI